MSEPKLISPLLGNHEMGEPISNHHGVRCCPAISKDAGHKYIVKIISIPASQVQLDALLLTGAFHDNDSALAYFKELADSAVLEAQTLQRLSRLEGFAGYEGWQIEPMEDGVGYDVYLLGTYRPTLEKHLSRNPMTHLSAVNLGLDLCAALAVCRQSGYLYVDLKPSNIFITENGEYKIGDLGFISMASLKYASLPDKYRSVYTPPEVEDAYSALSTTIDVYAVGMILYQAYNNGELPSPVPGEALPPPAYADYEMAEIILKACAADPAQRWQTPEEMGQELASYMQRNSVNDDLIVPPAIPEIPEAIEDEASTEDPEAAEEAADAEVDEASETTVEPETPETEEDSDVPAASEMQEDIDLMEDEDETIPNEEMAEQLADAVVSEEVTQILAQADDLIAHETPEPVVAPEPIDVPIPPRIVLPSDDESQEAPEEAQDEPEETVGEEAEQSEEAESVAQEEAEEAAEEVTEEESEEVEEESDPDAPVVLPEERQKKRSLVRWLAAILVILLLAVGAFVFYEDYYLQTINDMTLEGSEDQLTVILDTDIDNSLLTVICTDTYGNTKQSSVKNNTAVFTDLRPDTQYKLTVEMEGFHKLVGTTTDSYSTVPRTDIVNLTAVTGSEDGSVILNFSVQGQDNTSWRVNYQTDGEEEKSLAFQGHMVTITGLTVGKTYLFHLEPEQDIYVVGTNTVEYTASKLIYAEDLTIHGFENGTLSASWNVPAGVTVDSWIVRCYNDSGYDTTITVTDPAASFAGLNTASAYTIDVTASGMTLGTRAYVSADSITFKLIQLDDSKDGELMVSWVFEGTAPAEGWLLLYSINGGEPNVIRCESNVGVITGLIPGSQYDITVQPSTGVTVFGGTTRYTVAGGEDFNSFDVTAANLRFRMCWTPKNANWNSVYLYENEFTTRFKVGERASFVVLINKKPVSSNEVVKVLFVVRDSAGTPLSINSHDTTWNKMFADRQAELDLPVMPTTQGSYTVDIYFNGAFVTTESFTII